MERTRQTEFILIGNEKGGTAKTTTVICLANALTVLGYKVLVVDLDPSGNFSDAVLPDFPALVLYDVMQGRCHLKDAIVHTDICDVLPTVKDLAPEAESPFVAAGMPERKSLGDLFASWVGRRGAERCIYNLFHNPNYEPIFHEYDFVLMDSQPSDSLIITNAIVAANSILFPCEPVSGAMDGLTKFRRSIQLTQASYGATAAIDGLVFTKYKEDWNTRKGMIEQIQASAEAEKTFVYKTRFRVSPSIETAMNECQPILSPKYLYMGWGAYDAMNFALEFLARRGLPPRCDYPGVIRDEYGKTVFRRKGDYYWQITQQSDTHIQMQTEKFREHEVLERKEQIGKTLFFQPESIDHILHSARDAGKTITVLSQRHQDLLTDLAGKYQQAEPAVQSQ